MAQATLLNPRGTTLLDRWLTVFFPLSQELALKITMELKHQTKAAPRQLY